MVLRSFVRIPSSKAASLPTSEEPFMRVPHTLEGNERDVRSSVVSRRLKPRAPSAKPPEGG